MSDFSFPIALALVGIYLWIVFYIEPAISRIDDNLKSIADALGRAFPEPEEPEEITENDVTTAFCEMKEKEKNNEH